MCLHRGGDGLESGSRLQPGLFSGPQTGRSAFLKAMQKRYSRGSLCAGCLECVVACPNQAIVERNGKGFIQQTDCLTVGYCVGVPAVCDSFGVVGKN